MGQKENSRGSSAEHSKLVQEVLLALGKECSLLCRVFRNEVGLGLNPRTKKPFRYGVPGSPDIIGFTSDGKWLGLECKTGNAKQSEIQKNFQAITEKFNCLYLVVRSAQDAVSFVKNHNANFSC